MKEITDGVFLPFLNVASLWGEKRALYLLSSIGLKECEMQ